MGKKWLALLLTVTMLLSMTAYAEPAEATDVASGAIEEKVPLADDAGDTGLTIENAESAAKELFDVDLADLSEDVGTESKTEEDDLHYVLTLTDALPVYSDLYADAPIGQIGIDSLALAVGESDSGWQWLAFAVDGAVVEGFVDVEALLPLTDEDAAALLSGATGVALYDGRLEYPLANVAWVGAPTGGSKPDAESDAESDGFEDAEDVDGEPLTSVSGSGLFVNDGVGWRYCFEDGSSPKNRWLRVGSDWYYFDGDGYRVTGWLEQDGDYYYMDDDGVKVTNTVRVVDGTKYYFDAQGKRVDRPITSITLNRTSATIYVGKTLTLTATLQPTNASVRQLAWTSSDISVATVNASGKVTARGEGTAIITGLAQDGSGRNATCRVTVKPVLVTRITLSKTAVNVTVGSTVTLKATVEPTNATKQTVNWTSSDPSIATVTSAGKVTGMAKGTVTITAAAKDSSGVTAACKVTVKPILVTGITLSKTSATLSVGQTLVLKATATPENASDKTVNWTSSDTDIATVSTAGKVTAKAKGTVTITATAKDGSGKKATCKITVKPVAITGITLNKTKATLAIGKTLALKATVSPDNATNKTLAWTSSDITVATVTAAGKVTAVSEGKATITALAQDGSGKKATCVITVPGNVVPYPESEHPYAHNLDQEWTWTYPSSASYLAVTFSAETEFENKYDTLTVVDASGEATYTGTQLAGQTIYTTGRTFKLRLHSDRSISYYGFRITNITPVTSIPVGSVTVEPASVIMQVGGTKQLTATVLPANASNKRLTWKSNKTGVATVNGSGLVTAKGVGTATITATSAADGSKFGQCVVTVTRYPESEHPYASSLDQEWTYTHSTNAASLEVTFSADTELETKYDTLTVVDANGETTYTGTQLAGQTIITVGRSFTLRLHTDGSVNRYGFRITNIKARTPVLVTGITLTSASATMYGGESLPLTATVLPANATNKKLTWSSNKTGVATVSSSGVVTAKTVSTATKVTITATAQDGSGKKGTCTITVKPGQPSTKYYALCIGQEHYQNASNLIGCLRDAESVATMLRGLKENYTATVTHDRTANQILSDISSVLSQATSNDVCLFYYSGHGNSAGSLCGIDCGYSGGYVTTAQLANALNQLRCKKVIVMLDSCHSGAAIAKDENGKEIDGRDAFNQAIIDAMRGYTVDYDLDNPDPDLFDKSGELATNKFIVLTACTDTEVSSMGNPLSVFTYAAMRGMGMTYTSSSTNYGTYSGSMPADTNNDRQMTLNELFTYTRSTALALYSGQHAMSWGTGSEVVFRRQ